MADHEWQYDEIRTQFSHQRRFSFYKFKAHIEIDLYREMGNGQKLFWL